MPQQSGSANLPAPPTFAVETAAIKRRFAERFGYASSPKHPLHVVRAPGRVNLIGEHTDYNDGFVLPMAIEPHVLIAFRCREDAVVRVGSTHFPQQLAEFSLEKRIERGEPSWANYPKGVAAELVAAGIPLTGMDALFDNTLPVGGGLSSSAAIEVGTGLALLKCAGLEDDLSRERLALLCQKAEHEYAGVPVGIMDQMIVATAKPGHAMQYDCRLGTRVYVPLDHNELRVVIVNSMVRHELTAGEYARRRAECQTGVAYFEKINPEVKALRDVIPSMLEQAKGKLDDVIFRRCSHVVTENHRTIDAATALTQRKYELAGQLMVQSHRSLQHDYEVSCPELDFLVEEAIKVKGVYGARMTGGGFGGCIVALTQPRSVDPLRAHIESTYKAQFDITPATYVTTATGGAAVIE
jgi:galactokinase